MELAVNDEFLLAIIFPDATLHQMLLHKPQTLEEMGKLNGVGPQKLENMVRPFYL